VRRAERTARRGERGRHGLPAAFWASQLAACAGTDDVVAEMRFDLAGAVCCVCTVRRLLQRALAAEGGRGQCTLWRLLARSLVTTCLHAAVCVTVFGLVTGGDEHAGESAKCGTSQFVWNCLGNTGISRTYTVQPSCRLLENKFLFSSAWGLAEIDLSMIRVCPLYTVVSDSSFLTQNLSMLITAEKTDYGGHTRV
jgi:hypothetical protein